MEHPKEFDITVGPWPFKLMKRICLLTNEQIELVTNVVEQLRKRIHEELVEGHSAELRKLRDEHEV